MVFIEKVEQILIAKNHAIYIEKIDYGCINLSIKVLRQLAINNLPRLRRFFVSAQTISRGA